MRSLGRNGAVVLLPGPSVSYRCSANRFAALPIPGAVRFGVVAVRPGAVPVGFGVAAVLPGAVSARSGTRPGAAPAPTGPGRQR